MDWGTSAATVVGIGAVATALVKTIPAIREAWVRFRGLFREIDGKIAAKLELEHSLRAMRRVNALRAVMDSWILRKGAQRVLLLTANDSGEAWKGEGPLFVSNPAQVVGPGIENTINLWQNWMCDRWYIDFLGKLLETYQNRRCLIIATDQDVDGELKTQYEEQGTVCSLLIPFIWKEGAVLWFVSVNFGRAVYVKGDDGEYAHHPISAAEKAEYLTAMHAIYSNPAKCRSLVDELRQTWNSIR